MHYKQGKSYDFILVSKNMTILAISEAFLVLEKPKSINIRMASLVKVLFKAFSHFFEEKITFIKESNLWKISKKSLKYAENVILKKSSIDHREKF